MKGGTFQLRWPPGTEPLRDRLKTVSGDQSKFVRAALAIALDYSTNAAAIEGAVVVRRNDTPSGEHEIFARVSAIAQQTGFTAEQLLGLMADAIESSLRRTGGLVTPIRIVQPEAAPLEREAARKLDGALQLVEEARSLLGGEAQKSV